MEQVCRALRAKQRLRRVEFVDGILTDEKFSRLVQSLPPRLESALVLGLQSEGEEKIQKKQRIIVLVKKIKFPHQSFFAVAL